eukprot:Nk52_evm116s226 gene=Nk52_evmTU116s226
MAEDRLKSESDSASFRRPIPQRFYAEWEISNTHPTCVPRICNITVTHLDVLMPLDREATFIFFAVLVKGVKRGTLRSDAIELGEDLKLDLDLDLAFSLQYPHDLKDFEARPIKISLQKRKRVPNPSLGMHKSCCEAWLHMSKVLQKPFEGFMDLTNNKGQVVARAKLKLTSTSISFDHETNLLAGLRRDSREVNYDSSENVAEEPGDARKKQPKMSKKAIAKKLSALMHKFTVNKGGSESESGTDRNDDEELDEAAVLRELTLLSPSEGEDSSLLSSSSGIEGVGSCSVRSLAPFYSRNANEAGPLKNSGNEEAGAVGVDAEVRTMSGPFDKESSSFTDIKDHLAISLNQESELPPYLVLVNLSTWQGRKLNHMLSNMSFAMGSIQSQFVFGAHGFSDMDAIMSAVLARLNQVSPVADLPVMKIVLAGGDSFINIALRAYVQHFAQKPTRWQAFLKFLVVPVQKEKEERLAGRIGSLSQEYKRAFCSTTWREIFKSRTLPAHGDVMHVCSRISDYVFNAAMFKNFQVSEIQLNFILSKTSESGSSSFPFICGVEIGLESELNQLGNKVHTEEGTERYVPGKQELELQIDYFSGANKKSLKAHFLCLSITQKSPSSLPEDAEAPGILHENVDSPDLEFTGLIREKTRGVNLRFGKRQKDSTEKHKTVSLKDNIAQLTCLALGKNKQSVEEVRVDGHVFRNVKFFTVSSCWSTNVHLFPVAIL